MDLMTEDLIRYKRQILQRIKDPPLPAGNLLKDVEVQQWLAREIYNDKLTEELGAVYLKYELNRVINSIDRAVNDTHEEGVIDLLYEYMTRVVSLAAHEDALQRRLLRYHPPIDFGSEEEYIKILEKPLVIGSGSDTGNRTWEASLRLMHYLYSRPELVRGRCVLELGAGSGLLSIFCAAVLGASTVFATDSSDQILEALRGNIALNDDLWNNGRKWPLARHLDLKDALSDTVANGLAQEDGFTVSPDIILGADLIYDTDLANALGKNLLQISKQFDHVDIVIAATVRNERMLDAFEQEYDDGSAQRRLAEFEPPSFHQQRGLYHAVATPIRLYEMGALGAKEAALAARD